MYQNHFLYQLFEIKVSSIKQKLIYLISKPNNATANLKSFCLLSERLLFIATTHIEFHFIICQLDGQHKFTNQVHLF